MTFSLLLHSLEPKPTRQELEEISVNVPSVARADCAYMLHDWFGIVTSGLPLEEARAFQAGLGAKGIASDVVADFEIPSLHHDFRCQRIDLQGSSMTLTTAMNRRQERNKGELVFAAAGMLMREEMFSKYELQLETRYSSRGSYTLPVNKLTKGFDEKLFFRIDLFFSDDPHRVSLEIDKETVCFYGDRLLRMKNTTELLVLMVDLQSLLPPERMNGALRDLALDRIHPTMHAYEEELRWSFYRLGATG